MKEKKRLTAKFGFAAMLSLVAILAIFAAGSPAAQTGNDDVPLDGIPVRVAIPDGYMVSPGDIVTVTVGLKTAAVGDQDVTIYATVTSDPVDDGSSETAALTSYKNKITIDSGKVYGTFTVTTNPDFGVGVPHGATAVVRLEIHSATSAGSKVKRSYYTAFTITRPD